MSDQDPIALLELDPVREAEELGIPWQRILSDEIRAERRLRLCIADVGSGWPLWAALSILPISLLDSWRVRDRIRTLAWKASREECQESVRQLRALYAHLLGRRNGRGSDATLLAKHLWFGYQRVLSLMRAGRAAERTRGTPDERLEAVRKRTRCSTRDAQWAVDRAIVPRRGHILDDAVRHARDEGFELPQDENEVRAFQRLRSFVRSSPHLALQQNEATSRIGRARSGLVPPVQVLDGVEKGGRGTLEAGSESTRSRDG